MLFAYPLLFVQLFLIVLLAGLIPFLMRMILFVLVLPLNVLPIFVLNCVISHAWWSSSLGLGTLLNFNMMDIVPVIVVMLYSAPMWILWL